MNITNKSGIYKIENLVNGKIYVGQSICIKRRMYEHFSNGEGCKLLKRAINKYGKESFAVDVLEECSIDELNDREIYWIDLLNPEYNISKGGLGNSGPLTEKQKQKVSRGTKKWWNKLPQETKSRIIKNNLTGPPIGHTVSEETREKLRQANLGKKQSKETIEKRKLTTKQRYEKQPKDGSGHWKKVFVVEIGKEFESVKDCAKFIGVTPSAVSATANGRYKTCKGYHIKYVV